MENAVIVAPNEPIFPCLWPFVNDLPDLKRRGGVSTSTLTQPSQ